MERLLNFMKWEIRIEKIHTISVNEKNQNIVQRSTLQYLNSKKNVAQC